MKLSQSGLIYHETDHVTDHVIIRFMILQIHSIKKILKTFYNRS